MNKEQIIQLLINNLPAVIAVLGVVYTTIKIILTFKTAVSEIKELNDYSKLLDDLAISIQENYELKKTIAKNLKDNEELNSNLKLLMYELADIKETLETEETSDDTTGQED